MTSSKILVRPAALAPKERGKPSASQRSTPSKNTITGGNCTPALKASAYSATTDSSIFSRDWVPPSMRIRSRSSIRVHAPGNGHHPKGAWFVNLDVPAAQGDPGGKSTVHPAVVLCRVLEDVRRY